MSVRNQWMRGRGVGWLLGAVVAMLGTAGGGNAQSLPFHCWTTDDGLAQSVVNTLFEDSHGFLWAGTASGLSRFDGQRFLHFDEEHGLPSARIYALDEDPTGVLRAGTSRGVARFEPVLGAAGGGVWRLEAPGTDVATAQVSALAGHRAADGSWRLLVGSRDAGLLEVELAPSGPRVRKIDGPASVGALLVVPATETTADPPFDPGDSGGSSMGDTVWIGAERGLERLDGASSRLVFEDAPWTGGRVAAVAPGRTDDELLVASAAGSFAVTGSTGRWRRLAEADAGLQLTITAGTNDRVWIGTQRRGLLRVDAERLDRFELAGGLPVASVRALLPTGGGMLWVGTYGGGVCRLADEPFELFNRAHGLPNDQVLSIAETDDGILWVGTLEGGLARFDGERFDVFGVDDGLRSAAVTSLAVDADGALWIATLRGGLHVLRVGERRIEPVDLPRPPGDPPKEWPPSVFHVDVDSNGQVWLATWGSGVVRFDPTTGAVRWLTTADGLLEARVFSTAPGAEGRRWLAMPVGVQRLEPSAWRLEALGEGVEQPGRVRAVVDDGTVAYLATDRGVVRFDGARFTAIGRAQGMGSNTVYLLTADRAGRLWVGTDRGLDRIDLDALRDFDEAGGARLAVRHFGADEGFVGVETNQNAVFEDAAGRLWFGTRGLARFDPSEEAGVPPPPRLLIERLSLFDGTPIARTPSPRLEWTQNDLQVELAAVELRTPSALRYRYRLLGHSEGWSPPSASRTAVFPGLAPGDYVFEAAARGRGAWSEPVRLELTIRAPFWATWWFRAVLGLVVAGAFVGWLLDRGTRARRRRVELETAVRERTRELEVAKRAAEAANEAKSEFLSNMSHELRTPLTGVVSAAELLAKGQLDDAQRHLVDTIETSGRVLLSVINDILDQSRIDALGLQVEAREFSLTQCFRECLAVVRQPAADKGLELRSSVDPAVPERVIGDPVRLRQVLLNLLGNAVKFTDAGQIEVTVRRGERRGERLQILIEVRDTGIGIPPEQQRLIFEPFRQVDSSASRSHGGTGLGLSICERLVTLMGGSIRLESMPGEGSTFFVALEVGLPSETASTGGPSPAETIDASASGLPPIRADLVVLLAEDNPTSQLITRAQLAALGLEIEVASNGREAVEHALQMRPDIVFMDGQMPAMDGYEATRAIRGAEAEVARRGETAGRITIVGLTAHATAEARQRCLDAGMDDYLAKPVQLAELAELLARRFPAGE
ncbi:MAG: ATP-binding protein [Acidobacteriota bacterium]